MINDLVRTFDVTIKFDRTEYNQTFVPWEPNVTYDNGTLVSYADRIWQAASPDSTGVDTAEFNIEDWIEVPANWSRSIVQGKSYDTSETVGGALWKKIEIVLEKYHLFDREESRKSQLILEEAEVRYAEKYLTRVRLGQGAFRVRLTDAYQRKCAISGEKTLPALEAAHIKPYAASGPHYVSNGLLMRADMHKLFDSGYLTITRDYRVEVSGRIREVFENGKDYYQYHGQPLRLLPEAVEDRPQRQFIDWHNQYIYNG
jgi:putative restriction endonuclease